jgi:hypothetical protein
MMQFRVLTLRFEVAQYMITKIMVNTNTLRNKDLHGISYFIRSAHAACIYRGDQAN